MFCEPDRQCSNFKGIRSEDHRQEKLPEVKREKSIKDGPFGQLVMKSEGGGR
jgi:hypothetical protein